jgi:hypothetical protein
LQASANAARRSLLDASQLLATTMSAVTDNSQVFVELQRGHADRKNAAMLASLGLIESTTRKAAGDASAASLRISHDLGPVVAKLEETSAIIAQRATEVIGALAVLRKEEGQVSLRSIQNELARIRRRSTTGAVVVSVVLLILSAAVFSLLMRDSAFRQAAPVVRSR